MNTPTTDISTPLLFGRYRVFEHLGDGRLVAVYRANDDRLQRQVLLHLLRKDLVGQEQFHQRFIAEANAMAQCSHAALLEVFDSGVANERPYMITEFVSGQPLHTLGALTLEQTLLYMRQVVGAVIVCQTRGLPHPPISSSNVLIVDEGRAKLVESWLTPPDEIALDLAHYRAPERTEGQPRIPASAVYALGLLLYELVSGKRPIKGSDPWSVSQAHLTARIPPLSQARPPLYVPALERVIARSIARNPQHRFADAATFSTALDGFWRELNSDTQRLSFAPPAPPRQPVAQETFQPVPAAAPAPMPVSPPLPRSLRVPASDVLSPAPEEARSSGQTIWRKSMSRRGIRGWVVLLLLLTVVAIGSYQATSYIVDRVFAIELPRPTLPALGLDLPDWVPGDGGGEVFVVNAPALNVREEPGIDSNVIEAIPNNTRVRKLGGPSLVGDDSWIRVRAELEDRSLEGWVSERFLVPLE